MNDRTNNLSYPVVNIVVCGSMNYLEGAWTSRHRCNCFPVRKGDKHVPVAVHHQDWTRDVTRVVDIIKLDLARRSESQSYSNGALERRHDYTADNMVTILSRHVQHWGTPHASPPQVYGHVPPSNLLHCIVQRFVHPLHRKDLVVARPIPGVLHQYNHGHAGVTDLFA